MFIIKCSQNYNVLQQIKLHETCAVCQQCHKN
jgi:hypothetical protein